VTVGGDDIDSLSLVTSPPALITGRLVFDPAPADPSVAPGRFQIAFMRPFTGGNGTRPADDGAFEARVHGEGRLGVQPYSTWPPGWMIDSVLVGGVDVTPGGIQARNGEVIRDVQVVVTNRGASVEGRVFDRDGKPAHAWVAYLPDRPERRGSWIEGFAIVETDERGAFTAGPFRSGDYRFVAVESVAPVDQRDPEELTRGGTQVSLARGEKQVLTLTLAAP
jgi:hypothetical protein